MHIKHKPEDDVASGDGNKTIEWLTKIIRKDDVFIDCGAHVGFISVPTLLKANPKESFMIEPSKYACKTLEENLITNGIKNYTVINAMVLDKVGEDYYQGGSVAAHGSFYYGGEPVMTPTITIDSLVKEHNITSPIVIKMDIELSEPLAWKGMKESMHLIKAINMEFMASKLRDIAGVNPMEFFEEIENDGFRIVDYSGHPFNKHDLFQDDYKWDICIVHV